ncbi:predicted protein [Uncinocarpus reesii 1704]|uniref:Zn(2)-C6 fungal-type domain-containing protein n=1 Tax=Uncinocarpus reesii (strain UAMH 1704) TaxID=336963 RepID=C4JKM1_UNCRE|nr:uncharacterized protein UREG_00319 [Uncinocarpus reesii 1704]EEP75473.1 predicted protein [Uncinocarpus reesii 1704]
MSGSPSPEDRFNSCEGGKRKRSDSPLPGTLQPISEQSMTYRAYQPKVQGPDSSTGELRQPVITQPSASMISLTTAPEQPHLLPALGVAASIPPRPTTLPPRSTRRAKAHVASACVNCKRKHLGCDSARPCRRCVVAGKESSCVDVVHKRRGRPPLKAEEGPIRTYESAFGQSGTLRLTTQQPLHPNGTPAHQTASIRKIRPNTEFRGAPPTEAGREPQRLKLSPPIPMKNPSWGASMLPSPSATLPPSSPLSSVPPQRPLSSGNQTSSDRQSSIPSPSFQLPGPPYALNDISHLPSLSRDRLPPPRSPRQYKQSTSAPPYSTIPGPTTHPVNSAIRLPPIPQPLTKLKVDFSIDTSQAGSNTSSPLSTRPEIIRAESNPISPLAQEDPGLIERRWSHEQSFASSSYSLPPIRESTEPFPRQRCFSTSAMINSGNKDTFNFTALNEGTSREADVRPVKRRKMELGEMVND